MRRTMKNDHVFVVLAYQESPYLEACICSLENQTVRSRIIIATSTDNEYIRRIAGKHGLKVIVNHNSTGIAGDFDFGLRVGKARFVTVAHQDDCYEPGYLEAVLKHVRKDTIIAFTDYYEEHPTGRQEYNRNLKIKRMMLAPLRLRPLQRSKWVRRRILSLGNPICCPSVTFHRALISGNIFQSDFRSNMDWKAWEQLSKKKGGFVYIAKPLMMHRIHPQSTTTEMIEAGKRTDEDFRMMCLFWPICVARPLSRIYAGSEKNNR